MPGRYLTLNHWRGGAAIWVMLFHAYHIWLEGDPARLPAWFRTIADHGWQGVAVFFAISGYCITERIAEDFRRGRGPLRFLGDRALRIYPAYWAALLLVSSRSILPRCPSTTGASRRRSPAPGFSRDRSGKP